MNEEDAAVAAKQHVCLCRNEDVLLPDAPVAMEEGAFDEMPGFELRFNQSEESFLVGYNRFDENKPMYGVLEINGEPVLKI